VEIVSELMQEVSRHGDRLQIIPIKRIGDLKADIEEYRSTEELNSFQTYLLNDKFNYEIPEADFPIRSVLLLAIPHPMYAEVLLTHDGKTIRCKSLVMSDFRGTEEYLTEALAYRGYHIVPAPEIPLKRLAVRTGMSIYGRNNITYIEGMGSQFSYAAFYSDVIAESDPWRGIRVAPSCKNCTACLRSCPTGAIRSDRFLIDNERCLSYLNENKGEFPAWVSKTAHHCLYDCLQCQIICPMNMPFIQTPVSLYEFSEDETRQLLSGAPLNQLSPDLVDRIELLGMGEWLEGLPRNILTLFESTAAEPASLDIDNISFTSGPPS